MNGWNWPRRPPPPPFNWRHEEVANLGWPFYAPAAARWTFPLNRPGDRVIVYTPGIEQAEALGIPDDAEAERQNDLYMEHGQPGGKAG